MRSSAELLAARPPVDKGELMRRETNVAVAEALAAALPWFLLFLLLNAATQSAAQAALGRPLALGTPLLYAAIGVGSLWVRRRIRCGHFDPAWAEPTAALLISLTMAGYFGHARGVTTVEHPYTLTLLLAGTGSVVLSARWFRLVCLVALFGEGLLLSGMAGRPEWIEFSGALLCSALLGYGVLQLRRKALGRVVSARAAAESAAVRLAAQVRRYDLAVRAARDGVWEWDCQSGAVYYSSHWKQMLDYRPEEKPDTLGSWLERVDPRDRRPLQQALEGCSSGKTAAFKAEYRFARKNGAEVWFAASGLADVDETGLVRRVAGSQWDITRLKEAESRLRREAEQDPLTGLTNRAGLILQLERALEGPVREGDGEVAALFMDIDRFKEINDTLGHTVGDQFLRSVADRLAACVGGAGSIARYGGDEFVVLFEGQPPGTPHRIALEIQSRLHRPCEIDGHTLSASASVGLAYATPGASRPAELIRNADIAMYRAKARGEGGVEVFEPALGTVRREAWDLDAELSQALEQNRFRLLYQPVVRVSDGKVIGVEALLRWKRGELMLAPGRFMAAAERSGLMGAIDAWTLEQAGRQSRLWREQGLGPIPMTVNLSAGLLAQPEVVELVGRVLHTSELDLLELDISAAAVRTSLGSIPPNLEALAGLGVRLAIDDFDADEQAVQRLDTKVFQTVKLGKEFVGRIPGSDDSVKLVLDLATAARQAGFRVIAKGVETSSQLEILRGSDCVGIQGFLISHPVSADEIPRFVRSRDAVAEATPSITRLTDGSGN